jgi:hypothetical protein
VRRNVRIGAGSVLALALACPGLPSLAQSPPAIAVPPPQSEVRQLIEQLDVVVVVRRKAFPTIELDGDANITVSAVGAFEPGDEEHRVLGLRIDLGHKSLTHTEGRSYLDPHEAQKLVSALAQLEAVAAEGAKIETEADFVTNEGFTVGVRAKRGNVQYYVGKMDEERVVEANVSRKGFAALKQHAESALQSLFN